jgi:xanthine dehydrogenase accessory factor
MSAQHIVELAKQLVAQGRSGVLARIVDSTGLGPRETGDLLLVDDLGRTEGLLVAGVGDAQVREAARDMIAAGHDDRELTIDISSDAATAAGLTCGGTARVLLQRLDTVPAATWDVLAAPSAPHLLIVGESDVTAALTRQAELLGWTTSRAVDATGARSAVAMMSASDAVVVIDHDSTVATPVLADALTRGVGYVGALGSRRTQEARRQHLRGAGLAERDIERLHGPTGLDIGSRTPAESAVSIVAEIIATRAGRGGASLSTTSGRISGSDR